MGKLCNSCGYERKVEDIAPYYECPSCGIIYANSDKALEEQRKWEYQQALDQQNKRRSTTPKSTKAGKIFKYSIILSIYLLLIFLLFQPALRISGILGMFCFFIIAFIERTISNKPIDPLLLILISIISAYFISSHSLVKTYNTQAQNALKSAMDGQVACFREYRKFCRIEEDIISWAPDWDSNPNIVFKILSADKENYIMETYHTHGATIYTGTLEHSDTYNGRRIFVREKKGKGAWFLIPYQYFQNGG